MNIENEINVVIGKNIQNARNHVNWSQPKLAERSGLSRSTIAKMETYQSTSVLNVQKVAKAFNLPVFMFLLTQRDWKNLFQVFNTGTEANKLSSQDKSMPEEEYFRIQNAVLSEATQKNRDATLEINSVTAKLLNINFTDNQNDGISEEMTKVAAIGIAAKENAHDWLLNGIIAHLISR